VDLGLDPPPRATAATSSRIASTPSRGATAHWPSAGGTRASSSRATGTAAAVSATGS
jgi:hypothetical protein